VKAQEKRAKGVEELREKKRVDGFFVLF